MTPRNNREFFLTLFWVAAACSVIYAILLLSPSPKPAFWPIAPMLVAAAMSGGLLCLSSIPPAHPRPKVDIWGPQEELMAASCQAMPTHPQINSTVLLYYALMMEELGETAEAMVGPLKRSGNTKRADGRVIHLLESLGMEMTANARIFRKCIAEDGLADVMLIIPEAAEILDGITDVAVVAAGFGIAAGLPTRNGYMEVAASNLTKRNPVSLMIDKDASGKWLKPSSYRPPDLDSVLVEHYKALGEEWQHE